MLRSNQRYHDRIAPRYDEVYGLDAYWGYYYDVTWADLKRSLPSDLSHPVLDLGCGTGRYGIRLLESGYSVVFSDLSPRMLDACAQKVAAKCPGRAASFVLADVADLKPFDDGQFSLVVAQGDVLSFSTNWRKSLREVRRILCPGGRAVFSVDGRFGAADPFLARKDLSGLEEFLRTGQGTWLADREDERFPFHAFTPDELRQGVEDAGLVCVRIIGKTVFDLRGNHPWLTDPERRPRLLALEKKLGATPMALGRAHHLQVTMAAPGEGEVLPPPAVRRPRGSSKKRRRKG